MHFMAIDQGTTSTRALIVAPDGHMQVALSRPHKQYYPQPGWVEHDPEELIRNITACVNAAGAATAIGMDNQGESCMAWDAVSKKPLSPVIVWQDKRTTSQIETLKAEGHEASTLALAGLPLDPYFSASKLAWILANLPAAEAAYKNGTLRLGTTDAFFLDRLTGRFVTDVSTASRTSLMNLQTLQWDETLCGLFGVPIEVLPEIVPTTGDFGVMQTAHGPIPVTASVVDQQAALFGFGCHKKGDVKITFGTGVFALMVTGAEIIRQPERGLLPTVAWQLQGQAPVYALDGGVFTASAAINWAKDLGLFSEMADICEFPAPSAIEAGLAFVPALSGLGCPAWETRARGAWLGLSLEHTSAQLVQAVLEGIAFRTGQVIEAMNSCLPVAGAIPIDGGMSQNPYFTQFQSDVLHREICGANMPEITGFGAAKLAALAVGHDIPEVTAFTSYQPRTDMRTAVGKFEKACAMSISWAVDARDDQR